MMTDPISDMLTRIRNASIVKKSEIVLPYSNVKMGIANILRAENYVREVSAIQSGNKKQIKIALKYENGMPAIQNLKRISKPGNRVYKKATELPRIISGYGIAIVSTPSGIMTNKEAGSRKLGGEVICEIY